MFYREDAVVDSRGGGSTALKMFPIAVEWEATMEFWLYQAVWRVGLYLLGDQKKPRLSIPPCSALFHARMAIVLRPGLTTLVISTSNS